MLNVMKKGKLFRLLFIFFSVIFLATSGFSVNRHNFHTSLTRIEYNRDQKLFEISIQIFRHDLQPLLERKSRARIDLEKSKNVDDFIENYLNEEFVLTDKTGAAKKLKWVGKELDIDSVWVYLETDSTESADGYRLQNTLFFESFPEQTNLVIYRFEDEKADLMFKSGDRTKEIVVKPKREN